ncbi:hypothetical protein DFH09DRAFT_1090808 [Mycena vulgaris]|nr:hypothetical protein DFH09DRAFT_1090808 [Mycena vulgaris]
MAPHYGTERKLVLILTGINMQAACIAVTTAHAAAETSLAVANTHNTTEVNLVDNGGPTCCHCQWQAPTAPSNNPHILYVAHLRAMDITMHHPSRPGRPSRTCGALNSGMVSGLSLVGERSLIRQSRPWRIRSPFDLSPLISRSFLHHHRAPVSYVESILAQWSVRNNPGPFFALTRAVQQAETASLAASARTDDHDREIAVFRHEVVFLEKQLERTQQVCQHLQQKAEDALVAEREKVEEKQKALQAGEAEPARQREGISEDLTSATETIKALAARQKQLSTPTLIKAATRFLRWPPPAALNPVLYDTSNPLRLQSRYDFSNARRQTSSIEEACPPLWFKPKTSLVKAVLTDYIKVPVFEPEYMSYSLGKAQGGRCNCQHVVQKNQQSPRPPDVKRPTIERRAFPQLSSDSEDEYRNMDEVLAGLKFEEGPNTLRLPSSGDIDDKSPALKRSKIAVPLPFSVPEALSISAPPRHPLINKSCASTSFPTASGSSAPTESRKCKRKESAVQPPPHNAGSDQGRFSLRYYTGGGGNCRLPLCPMHGAAKL